MSSQNISLLLWALFIALFISGFGNQVTLAQTAVTPTPSAKTSKTATTANKAKVAPKLKEVPSKTAITECDAGDSKCMEEKAKFELKPTDGAIQDETR